MIWTLLFASLAMAQDSALEARLLGPEGPMVGPAPAVVGPAMPETLAPRTAEPALLVEATALPASQTTDETHTALDFLDALPTRDTDDSPGVPWYVPMVALVGAAGFYWTRRKKAESLDDELPTLRVVDKASLGGTAGIAVIEVQDGDRRRRLVIGTGDKQPVLLTELTHTTRAEPTRAGAPTRGVEVRGVEVRGVETREDRPVSRRAQGLSKALSTPARRPESERPANKPAQDWMAADPSSELGPRKAAARVLINQEMNRRATR